MSKERFNYSAQTKDLDERQQKWFRETLLPRMANEVRGMITVGMASDAMTEQFFQRVMQDTIVNVEGDEIVLETRGFAQAFTEGDMREIDIKPYMLASAKAKTSAEGRKYIDVPIGMPKESPDFGEISNQYTKQLVNSTWDALGKPSFYPPSSTHQVKPPSTTLPFARISENSHPASWRIRRNFRPTTTIQAVRKLVTDVTSQKIQQLVTYLPKLEQPQVQIKAASGGVVSWIKSKFSQVASLFKGS